MILNKMSAIRLTLATFIFIISFSKMALAKEVSTSEVMNQIQKTLLFSDKESAQKMSQEMKASKEINRSSVNKPNNSAVDIKVVNPSNDNETSYKEKLAYNAAIAQQYEVAVELYKQVLKIEPDNSYAKFALASSYHKLGQYKQAKTIYYQLLKSSDKNHDQIIGNLLSVIVEESPNDAVYLLSKLSSQKPNSAYILAISAMAYDKINKPDEAVLLLKRAINIDPQNALYNFNLAIIYDNIKDSFNALKLYKKVIELYVNSDNVENSIPIAQVKQRIKFLQN